jgi:hypothetical protein
MVKITTLPGTIEISKEDTIAFYREMFKDSGLSEVEILTIAERFCPSTPSKPSYRETRFANWRRINNRTKPNVNKVYYMKRRFDVVQAKYIIERIKYLIKCIPKIINKMIDFPGLGAQAKFRSKMMKLLSFLGKGND